MTEHEIFLARRSNTSKINHGNFRRKHLLAEKKYRIVKRLRKQLKNQGKEKIA